MSDLYPHPTIKIFIKFPNSDNEMYAGSYFDNIVDVCWECRPRGCLSEDWSKRLDENGNHYGVIEYIHIRRYHDKGVGLVEDSILNPSDMKRIISLRSERT